MSMNIPPSETQHSNNFVDAEDTPAQLSNPQVINSAEPVEINISPYEKERRCLFRIAFGCSILIILLLYAGLGYWIYSQSTGYHIHNNMWHIAVILALPPTTLLFLLLRVLAKQPDTETVRSYPVSEFLGQLIDILKEWVSKK